MSVLSSNTEDNIAAFLKKNGLELFEHIRSSNLFGKDKAIGRFMRQLGLQTDELLYVGDELRDIEACKKAGVRIVAVAWGYDPLPLLVSGNPDGIAKTPEELLRFVRRMQSRRDGVNGRALIYPPFAFRLSLATFAAISGLAASISSSHPPA